MTRRSVVLASQSPRRRSLLESAGYDVVTRLPMVDDAAVDVHGSNVSRLVESLAWFKAAQVSGELDGAVAIVAADTVCDVDGRVLGKPADRSAAKSMLEAMSGRSHTTRTGVCVRVGRRRVLFHDASVVSVGRLAEDVISAYLDSGDWRGKAGAYNLSERMAAGWPIECEGDPTTVMGLPMRKLVPLLEDLAGENVQGALNT